MTSPLDKLNLRPFEKRLVVGVAVVIFIVVNAVFVFPHFGALAQADFRMEQAREKRAKWQSVVDEKDKITKLVNELSKQGSAVEAEEQVYQFKSTIESQARNSGVSPRSSRNGARQLTAWASSSSVFRSATTCFSACGRRLTRGAKASEL